MTNFDTTGRHFEFTGETRKLYDDTVVHRIRAARDLPRLDVKAGGLGGWIASPDNIVGDEAWVEGDAAVYGSARVADRAVVTGFCSRISEEAFVGGNTYVWHSLIYGNARIGGDKIRIDGTSVWGSAVIEGDGVRVEDSFVSGNARIYGHAYVARSAISGNARVCGSAHVENSTVRGNATVVDRISYDSLR